MQISNIFLSLIRLNRKNAKEKKITANLRIGKQAFVYLRGITENCNHIILIFNNGVGL